MRHDLADIFYTTSEGVRGQKAKDWRLVDDIAKSAAFAAKVQERALELAKQSDRPAGAKGVALPPLQRTVEPDALRYSHVTVDIDRSKRTEAWNRVAAQGAKVMARGHWVIMFPEGTRIARGKAGTYKSGGTRLAVATGRPVVPIAVNSARCWPRKSFLLTPGVVDVSIGRPIASVGREADEMMREVETWIEAEMRRIDPEAYAPGSAAAPAAHA